MSNFIWKKLNEIASFCTIKQNKKFSRIPFDFSQKHASFELMEKAKEELVWKEFLLRCKAQRKKFQENLKEKKFHDYIICYEHYTIKAPNMKSYNENFFFFKMISVKQSFAFNHEKVYVKSRG